MENTFTKDLLVIYEKGLLQLRNEIALISRAELIWKKFPGITNSCGNLCLHLIGNLNHFIGAELGNTGYVRNREEEFSAKDISKEILLKMIDETIEMLKKTIPQISNETLAAIYKGKLSMGEVTTQYLLLHLLNHLSYHNGQVNYLRRILEEDERFRKNRFLHAKAD